MTRYESNIVPCDEENHDGYYEEKYTCKIGTIQRLVPNIGSSRPSLREVMGKNIMATALHRESFGV